MSRKSGAPPTKLARNVTATIKRLREDAAISHAELIRRAELSPNYYYTRMRGEAPFDLDDLSHLAAGLNVGPVEVLTLAVRLPDVVQDDRGVLITIAGVELGRRLRFLQATSVYGLDVDVVDSDLREVGFAFSGEDWDELVGTPHDLQIYKVILEALAGHFHVPSEYLIDDGQPEVADRLEAELEFDRAVKDAHVQRVAARSLGSLDAAEIRALAAAIRD